MEVAADKHRDLFGKTFRVEQRAMIGRERGGEIEKFADHLQELALRFGAREPIARFGSVSAELSREVPKAIGENCGIRRSCHRCSVLCDTG